jgi:hypothetical protein
MRPNELINVLQSISSAADFIEAIDQPILQSLRGWDLAEWSYDLVPWGVAFFHNGQHHDSPTLVAVALPERLRHVAAESYPVDGSRTTVLMLG